MVMTYESQANRSVCTEKTKTLLSTVCWIIYYFTIVHVTNAKYKIFSYTALQQMDLFCFLISKFNSFF